MSKIYITGHKNPDTDSICSALAYQELKRQRSKDEVVALRLGSLNQETKFVLDYFGVEAPLLKESIKTQVKDLKMDMASCISSDISIYQAFYIMQQKESSNLPIIDSDENLIGIVSLSDITESYMNVWDDRVLFRSGASLENISSVLSSEYIVKPDKTKEISGKMSVYALSPSMAEEEIDEGDIVLIGDRPDAQASAIEKEVSLIILTHGVGLSDENIKRAKEKGVTVISTHYPTFMVTRLLPMAAPVKHVMTKDDLVVFHLDDALDEVKEIMAKTRYRSYPVLDERNRVIGSISRFHLISQEKKKLILVDHNEKNQSIADIEAAEIVEIIDHHRVANISTASPVYFRCEPLGSTSTIIAKMFFEEGIMPSKRIAGLLSAAIISDTLLFKSPTTTDTDRRMLDRLSKIADIDPETFAMEMFRKGTSLEGKSPKELIGQDMKSFSIGDEKFRVSQIFTMDISFLSKIKDELLEEMERVRLKNSEDSFVLILTDIFKETSRVLVVGAYGQALADSYGSSFKDNAFDAPGLLSRKKQFLPLLNQIVLV